jgi:hypothetical protein
MSRYNTYLESEQPASITTMNANEETKIGGSERGCVGQGFAF